MSDYDNNDLRKPSDTNIFNSEDKIKNENQDDEVEKNIINNKNDEVFRLSRTKRCWFFVLFLVLNLIINMDNGTVPALIDEIAHELEISKDIIGLFGSLQYGGNLLGSLILLPIINKWNRKMILIFCNIINIGVLLTFIYVKNVYFTSINRVIAGVIQAFIAIYFPIWVDQFGSSSSKTLMMAFQQVSSPLGVVLGYILTYLIRMKTQWQWSFKVQAIILGITTIGFFFLPNIFFSIKIVAHRKHDNQKKNEREDNTKKNNEEKRELSEINAKDIDLEIKKNSNLEESKDEYMGNVTIFKPEEIDSSLKESECTIICRNMKFLFKEQVFIFSSLAISVLLFISTVITFWVSDYLKNVMQIDPDTIFILFVVTCVTAPALGIVGGGFIVQKAGGYESKHSILYCLVFSLVAGGLSILTLTPLTDSVIGFGIILWLFLFFGGALIPNMVGILLHSLTSRTLKGAGNSLNLIVNASIGYLPGPYVYGIMYKELENTNKKLAFSLCLLFSWIGVFFIVLALIYRYRKFRKDEAAAADQNEVKIEVEESERNKNESGSKNSNEDQNNIIHHLDHINIAGPFFSTVRLSRFNSYNPQDENKDVIRRFHKSMEIGPSKKPSVKLYYDLSEVDEVYDHKSPQIILNTDNNEENNNKEKNNLGSSWNQPYNISKNDMSSSQRKLQTLEKHSVNEDEFLRKFNTHVVKSPTQI